MQPGLQRDPQYDADLARQKQTECNDRCEEAKPGLSLNQIRMGRIQFHAGTTGLGINSILPKSAGRRQYVFAHAVSGSLPNQAFTAGRNSNAP